MLARPGAPEQSGAFLMPGAPEAPCPQLGGGFGGGLTAAGQPRG